MKRLHPSVAARGLTLLLVCVLAGCGARQASFDGWQDNLERYVEREGNGDPAVLRDLRLPGGDRRGYAMLGADDPRQARDANGLLVGFREAAGRGWFVYLVGIVDRESLTELRAAAFSPASAIHPDARWLESPGDEDALARYLSHARGRPASRFVFPREDDVFRLDLLPDGTAFVVTHAPSGARWELRLPNAERRQTARHGRI